MDDRVKQILKNPIQIADQVIKAFDKASYCRPNNQCGELKSITEELATLLRQAAKESSRLHERPTQRIIQETEQALCKALSFVKFRLFKLLFPTIRAAAFRKVSFCLRDSIENVSWLLRIFNVTHDRNGDHLSLVKPSMVVREPFRCRIWEQIAILLSGSPERRSDAAAILVSLAHKDKRYRKWIIEEGGVSPLLKLLTWGNIEGQATAARAIGLLGHDSESVKHMIHVGVCSVFAEVLESGPTMVQAVVAWAVCQHVESYPECRDDFAEHNIVRLLVKHLALLSTEVNSKKGWVPMTLWLLAKGNPSICRSLAESFTLLDFVDLLGTGLGDLQYYSIMALMEITSVAERDADLREFAFKPNSPACKAILDQVYRIFSCETDSELLIPCIKTIGNLARATTEARMIGPLARLRTRGRGYRGDRGRDVEVIKEALIALIKYACTENDLHMEHSKAILRAVGLTDLRYLVYFGAQMVRIPALVLLSYIALHLPNIKYFARFKVLAVLEWASNDSSMILDEFVEELLRESKSRLELASKFF